MRISRLMYWCTFGAVLLLLNIAVVSGRAQQARRRPRRCRVVDYNWDVRPILSENCFRCHGPDEKSRRAGLRLDQPDGAYAALNAGTRQRHAIVPGNPDDSELIRRVTHAERRRCACRRRSRNKMLTRRADRHAAPVDCAGRAVQAALGVHRARQAGRRRRSTPARRGAQRHRPLHRQPAGARRAGVSRRRPTRRR